MAEPSETSRKLCWRWGLCCAILQCAGMSLHSLSHLNRGCRSGAKFGFLTLQIMTPHIRQSLTMSRAPVGASKLASSRAILIGMRMRLGNSDLSALIEKSTTEKMQMTMTTPPTITYMDLFCQKLRPMTCGDVGNASACSNSHSPEHGKHQGHSCHSYNGGFAG